MTNDFIESFYNYNSIFFMQTKEGKVVVLEMAYHKLGSFFIITLLNEICDH
jgi:hypothetical protein